MSTYLLANLISGTFVCIMRILLDFLPEDGSTWATNELYESSKWYKRIFWSIVFIVLALPALVLLDVTTFILYITRHRKKSFKTYFVLRSYVSLMVMGLFGYYTVKDGTEYNVTNIKVIDYDYTC